MLFLSGLAPKHNIKKDNRSAPEFFTVSQVYKMPRTYLASTLFKKDLEQENEYEILCGSP